eukprot:TRINITY_DN28710_c0_g1_i1.p1 TRINITY_DN28710_c0_g1~~TRINITY_DN28710_c0_g1_i1.p1  ORF type:complete len:149 (-),score=30.96 TRINITY_DN28710_c0_g1_i1:240-686(-)
MSVEGDPNELNTTMESHDQLKLTMEISDPPTLINDSSRPNPPSMQSDAPLKKERLFADAASSCTRCKKSFDITLELIVNMKGEGESSWVCPQCKARNQVIWPPEAIEEVRRVQRNKRKINCCLACCLCCSCIGGTTVLAAGGPEAIIS